MLGGKNTTGDASSIINTHGSNNTTNVYNNNLDIKMIEVIVKGIMHDSLPVFQEQARQKVQDAMQDYVIALIDELVEQKTPASKIEEKLPSPDIQYSIFETAKAYAKSTVRADKNTLINLVVQKINANEEDYDELASLDLAIEASSKLGVRQIKFLSFVNYIHNIAKFSQGVDGEIVVMDPSKENKFSFDSNSYDFGHGVIRSKEEIESLYIDLYTKQLIDVFPEGDLSMVSLSIPLTLGCISATPYQSCNLVQNIKRRTGLDLTDQHHAAKLKPLMDRISIFGGVESFDVIVITDIGSKVGAAYLSTKMKLFNS